MRKAGILLAFAWCLLWTAAGAEAPATEPAPDAPGSVEEVLGRLEERASLLKTLTTGFVQEKNLAVLEKPLVLTGTIFMQQPTLFAWHVREPLKYSMVIQGDVLRQWDEDTGKVQKMSLSRNPALKAAIGQMRGWFSGAYKSMLGEYEVTILDEDPTSLRFVPRQTSLAKNMISSVSIVLHSDERYIRQIRILETSGDSTLLSFVDTLLNTPIDPSAWVVEQRVR